MENFPKCDVCHLQFSLKGPSPFLLPCLHTACEKCVTSAEDTGIKCPACDKVFKPDGKGFPKDAIRKREIFCLTVKHCPSELLCTHSDDGNQAVSWCPECGEFLCQHCQKLHEEFKVTRSHAVQEVGDTAETEEEVEVFCSIHKRYLIDLFDHDCKCLICSRCFREEHRDHKVDDICVAAESAKYTLESNRKNVSDVADQTESSIATLKKRMKLADNIHTDQSQKINLIFSVFSSLLEQRQKEVVMTLLKETDEIQKGLQEQYSEIKTHHCRGKVVLDYIDKVLMYASKYDLPALARSLKDITQPCLEVPLLQDTPRAIFGTNGAELLKTMISKFGYATTSEEAAPVDDDFVDKFLTGTGAYDIENEIDKWRKFCMTPDMMEKTFKEIATKNDKLEKLAEKQQMEISRLRQQMRRVTAKPKKQVHAYLYNPQQDHTLPMSDITSRLGEVLLSRNIQFLPQVIETSPLTERTRPVILPCVNVSRLGTDVSNAVRDVTAGRDVAVVVLHHKDIHVLPKLSSEKVLTGAEFQSLGAIVDMAFWKEKGLYQCDINQKAIVQLADFLANYVVRDIDTEH